ncbi:MAG: M28 family peptidase [Bryobacteraceae bacterium]|jgi:hypothetical protein
MNCRLSIFILCAALLVPGASRLDELPAPEQAAIDRISADTMRGDLSFLASDALEGRATPSRGLDIAAEFIASRFRAAGLEPVTKDGSYFQKAPFAEVTPKLDDFHLTLQAGREKIELTSADVRIHTTRPLDLKNVDVVNLPPNGNPPPVEDKVVAGDAKRYGNEAALRRLQALRPALILLLGSLRGPEEPHPFLEEADSNRAPVIRVGNGDAASALSENRRLIASLHLSAPVRRDVMLENVAGILRGSDPVLRDHYVLLTAHYDHVGMLNSVSGAVNSGADRIYNGANDNSSGVVSVTEIASALGTLNPHPRRSIVFMTFFGEEEGLLGSSFYVRHPLVPLKETVANVNLEQMGRTDDKDGPEVGAFAFTGPSYSDLPARMTAPARIEGVKVYNHRGADDFFDRSDNYAFAQAGIVAHTIAVAFEFPDYHAVGDEWQKIDYANLAKVDRAVAAGLLDLADADAPPRWSNTKEAQPYREAGR